jgi:polysaccharide deacetylase 2 family uncharacterized protein YibQ
MTRKSPPSAAKPRKKKSSRRRRKPAARSTVYKIAGGLALLVVLVVGAGLALWHLAPAPSAPPPDTPVARRSAPPAATRARRPPETRPAPPVARTAPETRPVPPPAAPTAPAPKTASAPVYEVFPPQEIERPQPKPVVPPPGPLPRVAIIIDDIGYDRELVRRFLALDVELTFAVLPFSPFQQSITADLRRAGYELMLHLPMEPVEYPRIDPGPGALLDRMEPDELIVQLQRNLDSLPEVRGVNNHMGSRLTAHSSRMYQIFSVLKKRGLYFVDSRSTADTVCEPSARLFQLPFAERDVFLDHVVEAEFIRAQFRRLVKEAQRSGEAVAIAHPHDLTVRIFAEQLPRLRGAVQLVPASAIVRIPGGS